MCEGDRFEPLRAFLYAEMKERGWSICCMAREIKISPSVIGNLLNHVSDFSLVSFQKVAAGLDVSLPYLLSLAGYMPPEPPRVTEEKRLLVLFRALSPAQRQTVIVLAESLSQSDPRIEERHALFVALDSNQSAQVRALIDQCHAALQERS